ncbi:MAG: DUF6090 family protein [Gammaproteobacteria bacterium]|nr:DUF6090 family protein [Gammaproteobacteria bacterium]
MILRRVMEHVRKQEWTAIGIDLVVVVIGVVIGIQVSNWNAQRLDQRLAQRYLADISSDVRSDLAELKRVEDSAMDRISASAYILQQAGIAASSQEVKISDAEVDDLFANTGSMAIPEPPTPSESMRTRLWEAAFEIYAFDMNRGAYDALVGAGKLDLINDQEIMRVLREYYYLVNVLDRTQQRTSFPIRNATLEIGMTHGLSPGLMVDEATLIAQVKATPSLAASVASSRQFAGLIFLLSKVQKQKGEELLKLLAVNCAP